MGKVEFTEVDGTELNSNIMGESKIVEKKQDDSLQGTVHLYIAFKKDVAIGDGVDAIENQITGANIEILRKDDTGNAVVALVDSSYVDSISGLAQVDYTKIDNGRSTTVKQESGESGSVSDSAVEGKDNPDTQTVISALDKYSEDENTSEEEADTEDSKEHTISQVNEINTETQEVNNSRIEANLDPSYTPVIVSVLLGLAILFTVLFLKKK